MCKTYLLYEIIHPRFQTVRCQVQFFPFECSQSKSANTGEKVQHRNTNMIFISKNKNFNKAKAIKKNKK